jgi:hypothetical protein
MRPRFRPAVAAGSSDSRRRAKPLDASGGGVQRNFTTPPPRTPRMSYIARHCLERPELRDVTHGVLSSPLKGEGFSQLSKTLRLQFPHRLAEA